MARRFLYIIAGLIMLTLAIALGWAMFQDKIMRAAFVPGEPFRAPTAATAPDYDKATAWIARPGLPSDPSRWTPAGFAPASQAEVAVFFVHPTTFVQRTAWNAPLGDPDTDARARHMVSGQASAFNGVGAIWAPRYRQATIGAFLASSANADKAIDFAYQDVARAFDSFVAQQPPSRPILLAAHSQGALHLMRLLKEKVAGTAIAPRVVAAYLVGWPVSTTADLPALGLPACAQPGQANCILSWQSFAEPADPNQILDVYRAGAGLTGAPRRETPMLCVNPITGAPGTAAVPGANLGALVPTADMSGGTIERGTVPARCDARGFLMIGAPPKGFDGYVMPGNNYHLFDYALFWANIRADAERRTHAFLTSRSGR